MDLHRLRLLDFNSFHGKEYKKQAKQKEVKHICLNSVDNNDRLEKLSTNKTSTNSPSGFPLAKKPLFRLHTSRSEIIKTPVKDTLKSLGNCINSSLGDIYKNSFSIKKKTNPRSDFFNGDNVPRSKKTRTNSRENRKSKDKKINILYSRDFPTSNSLRIKKKEGRIGDENNNISTFSKDIFGFPKTTNSEKLSTYRNCCSSHRNENCNNTQKESEHRCEPKHGDPEIIDLKLRSERKIGDSSILYNKVNTKMQNYCQQQGKVKLLINAATAIESEKVSNSSIKPVKKVGYDEMGSSRDIYRAPFHDTPSLLKRSTSIEKISCSPQQDRHRQHKSKSPIRIICFKNKRNNNMFSSKKSSSNKPKTLISLISKSYKKLVACTKYIIYGSLIIIWSPCILVIMLACKLPVKLANMLAKDPAKSCTKRIKKCPKTYEKRWHRRASDTIVNTYNTFLSILKIQKKKPPLCAISTHPNPKKRYTLFYTNHRGWLMKPIRNKKKSICNNFYNMQCEQKTTFNRCSKCPNKATVHHRPLGRTLSGKIENLTGMSYKRGCPPINNLPLPKKYNTCEPVIHLKPCPHSTYCPSKRRSLNKRYIKLSKAIPHCFDTKSCPQVHKEYGHAVCPRCGRRRRQGPLFHTNSCLKLRCCCISSPSDEQRCQPYYQIPARSKYLSTLLDRGHLRSIPTNNRNLPYNQSPPPSLKDNHQNLPYNHLRNQLPKGDRRLSPPLENRKWSCTLDAGKPRHDNSLPCQQSTYPFPIECKCDHFHDFKNKRYSSPVSYNNHNKAKTQKTFFNKNKTEKVKCNKSDKAKTKEKRKIDKEKYKLNKIQIDENIKSKKLSAKMKREIEKEKYKNIKEQILLDRLKIKMHRKNKKCLCKKQINNENRRYIHMSKGANENKRKSNTKRKSKNKPAIFNLCNKISGNTKNYFKDCFESCEDDSAIGCNDMFMTKRPCMYRNCPKLYICSQNCHRCLRQICSIYCILFSLSFWTSIFWCCSLCLCI